MRAFPLVAVKMCQDTAKMPREYVWEKKLLYEIDHDGRRVLVRSEDSSRRAYLRFKNNTTRLVDVWWRDFRGERHRYICLEPGAYADINTFITHPWEFKDPDTGENFVINNCLIFRAPSELGGLKFRTNWNITVQVRTLRFAAMLTLAENISSSELIRPLGLPSTLEAELGKLVRDIHAEKPIVADGAHS